MTNFRTSKASFKTIRLDISDSEGTHCYSQTPQKDQLPKKRDYREGSLGGMADTLAFTKMISH